MRKGMEVTTKSGRRVTGLWWQQANPVNPIKGKKLKAPEDYSRPQTYANYHKDYFQSKTGKKVRAKAQAKYRDRLRKKWGVGYIAATKLERLEKQRKALYDRSNP